jgi:hypothetical protein
LHTVQSEHLQEANPVDRFLTLLRSAISGGHAHIAMRDGGIPDNPGAKGWRSSRSSGSDNPGEPDRCQKLFSQNKPIFAECKIDAVGGDAPRNTLLFGASRI